MLELGLGVIENFFDQYIGDKELAFAFFGINRLKRLHFSLIEGHFFGDSERICLVLLIMF